MTSRAAHPSKRRALATFIVSALVTACAAGLTLAAADPAGAAAQHQVFHVSSTGSSAGNGSAARPWGSLATATALAPAGSRIVIAGGTYQPFTVTQPGQTLVAAPGQRVVVQGRPGVQDVIRIQASLVTLNGLTVTGCVPSSTPPGGYGDGGSSDVRIDDGTTGVILRALTITSSQGTNSDGLPFGCYGIFAHNANAFRVVANDISGTGAGVYVDGGGAQSVVANNAVHDNNVIIRDTPGAAGTVDSNDDFGGSGIAMANVSAVPGVLAIHNVLTSNQGPSADYGTDGGGFEIYNASNSQMIGNTIANNDVALETGAPPGGVCAANVFRGNQVSGRSAGSSLLRSPGLLLRCATAMVISHNTFTDLDWWVFDLETNDIFSTNVDGLAITGNTVSESLSTVRSDGATAGAPAYQLGVSPINAKLAFNGNRFSVAGSVFAQYVGPYDTTYSSSPTLADWQTRTKQDLASITF